MVHIGHRHEGEHSRQAPLEEERLRASQLDTWLKEEDRRENLRRILHWLTGTGLIVIGLLFIAAAAGFVVTVVFLLIGPEKWHWLSEQQERDLRTSMSTLLLAGAALRAPAWIARGMEYTRRSEAPPD